MRKFSYNVKDYGWEELIREAFGVDDVSILHQLRADLHPAQTLDLSTESKTGYHEIFYGKMNAGWDALTQTYKLFISNEIAPFFEDDFLYQYMPTFRVHLPHDQAIHGWHCDSEPGYDHPLGEINIQLAITDMDGTSATWVESVPGLGDFHPMNMKYGEFVIFNGNKCIHGNKINLTEKTRISLDFRVMSLNKYEDNGIISATSGKKFIIGDYYTHFKMRNA